MRCVTIESSNIARSTCESIFCSGSFTSGSITALYKPFWARVSKVSKRRYIDNVIYIIIRYTDKGTNVSELKASAVHLDVAVCDNDSGELCSNSTISPRDYDKEIASLLAVFRGIPYLLSF